jgi:hypothetical protein
MLGNVSNYNTVVTFVVRMRCVSARVPLACCLFPSRCVYLFYITFLMLQWSMNPMMASYAETCSVTGIRCENFNLETKLHKIRRSQNSRIKIDSAKMQKKQKPFRLSPAWDLNSAPPEYKARILPAWLQYSSSVKFLMSKLTFRKHQLPLYSYLWSCVTPKQQSIFSLNDVECWDSR